MKKWMWGILGVVVILVVVLALTPLYSVYQIENGIEKKNSDKLNTYIAFEDLRVNLKDQLNNTIESKFNKNNSEGKENSFSQLTSNFAKRFANKMVDHYVSPEGLSKLMGVGDGKDKEETQTEEGVAVNTEDTKKTANKKNMKPLFEFSTEDKLKLLKNSDFSYKSPSMFTVSMPTKNNKTVTFILEREGLLWKLTNIVLPIGNAPVSAES